jgi:hypothetical protein
MADALRASEVRVRTTPFTCGCQASVAINIRIGEPKSVAESVADSQVPTFCQGYFKRVTSQTPEASFFMLPTQIFVSPLSQERNNS